MPHHVATTVLLGESTHGTEEFYRLRAEVTKRLVEERGFTVCCFEADFPLMGTIKNTTHKKKKKKKTQRAIIC
jgi:erythromycin esterase-like protein